MHFKFEGGTTRVKEHPIYSTTGSARERQEGKKISPNWTIRKKPKLSKIRFCPNSKLCDNVLLDLPGFRSFQMIRVQSDSQEKVWVKYMGNKKSPWGKFYRFLLCDFRCNRRSFPAAGPEWTLNVVVVSRGVQRVFPTIWHYGKETLILGKK